MKSGLQKIIAFAFGTFAAVSAPAASAQTLDSIDEGFFKSVDLNGNGEISRAELLHFTDLVFLSMDSDGNEELVPEEFLRWDPGYLVMADDAGRLDQYLAAKRRVFDDLDIDGDGILTHDEHSAASLYSFYNAREGKGRMLDKDVFLNRVSIVKSFREAAR